MYFSYFIYSVFRSILLCESTRSRCSIFGKKILIKFKKVITENEASIVMLKIIAIRAININLQFQSIFKNIKIFR